MHGTRVKINKYNFRQTQPFVILPHTTGIDQKIIIFKYYITEVLRQDKNVNLLVIFGKYFALVFWAFAAKRLKVVRPLASQFLFVCLSLRRSALKNLNTSEMVS